MRQKSTYNKLLLQYKKYVSKLERFEKEDKNQHRQKVLKTHIAKLLIKLRNLFKSIQKISAKETAFASVFCAMAFTTTLTAQTFTRSADTTPFGLMDLDNSSEFSAPNLKDLDGDGDLDLMSGRDNGEFAYFQNTGSSSAPAFATKDDNPFGLVDIGNMDIDDVSFSTLEDLDSDGDLDLMSGKNTGDFVYFENTGTSSAPAFAAKDDNNPFGLVDIGDDDGTEYSSPALVDLDGDGDLDLISGRLSGAFVYFENTGSSSAPAFAAKDDNNPFGLVDIDDGNNYSIPTLADLDGDGDLDLISGRRSGAFVYFENTGSSSAPAFAAKDDNNPFGLVDIGDGTNDYSNPTLADLDGDGDLDLISGEYDGGFVYFENTAPLPPSLSVEETKAGLSGLSYNSINGTLNNPNGILLKNGSIFDITGRELYRFDLESRSKEQEISAIYNLPQGIYILKIDSDFGVLSLKILVE